MCSRQLALVVTVLALTLGAAAVHAQTASAPPPIGVNVVLNAGRYVLNDASDPITVQITLANTSCQDGVCRSLVTSEGFTGKLFHLMLVFIGPDGKPITAGEVGGHREGGEGPPPRVIFVDGVAIQVDPVEILDADYTQTVLLPDARVFYALTTPGRYRVKAAIAMRTYPGVDFVDGATLYSRLDSFDFEGFIQSPDPGVPFSIVADADGDGYASPEADPRVSPRELADCNDDDASVNPGAAEILNNGVDDDCNPATPDVVAIAGGNVTITAERHTVGAGTRPSVRKEAIAALPVHVFDRTAGSCARRFGTSWRDFKSVWLSCTPVSGGVAKTDVAGVVKFELPPGEYLAIGEHDPTTAAGDEVYLGTTVGEIATGSSVQKHMQLIVKADGKAVPAKATTRTGSLLRIIEPEFVEWSGTQELYPFVIETFGEWNVTTSVQPPNGFVADHSSLSAEVADAVTAVQFTVTNVGSDWVSTEVTHQIKHKGKSETIRTRIGIKLHKELAKVKGLTPFGARLPGHQRR
jgi:hypothetical protein